MLRSDEWNIVAQFFAWEELREFVLTCKSCYYINEWLSRARFDEAHIPTRPFKKMRLDRRNHIPECVRDVLMDRFPLAPAFPSSLTHLSLGYSFNKDFAVPLSVTHLNLGHMFNRPITIPDSVTHLIFGSDFNQHVYIPSSVTHLTFGYTFGTFVEIPNSVTHLGFSCFFSSLVKIPQSVTHFCYNAAYFFNYPTLPTSVTHITFRDDFYRPFIIPNSVTHVTFSREFNSCVQIPLGLTHLVLGEKFQQRVRVPESSSLRVLQFKGKFTNVVEVPKNLKAALQITPRVQVCYYPQESSNFYHDVVARDQASH